MPPVNEMSTDMGPDDATFSDIESISSEESDTDYDTEMDLYQDNWDIPVQSKSQKKSTEQSENLDVEEGDITGEGTKLKKDSKKDEELTDEELEAKETKVQKDDEEKELEVKEEIKPIGKIIPAKLGDKESTIDTGAVVKWKVDGKMTDIKIQDALDKYSGQLSLDKKFKDFAIEKKTIMAENERVKKYEAHLKTEMGKVSSLVDEALNGKAKPLEPFQYLLDLMGKDSFVYYRKAMEGLFDEFAMLYDMDENQQKAYWTGKENEHLRKNFEKTKVSQQREQENQRVISQVEAAQKEAGVDWDTFTEALEYLSSLTDEKGKPVYQEKHLMDNPKAVAQYAARMPYITKAEALLKPFEENIGDDQIVALTDEVSKLLHESKGASETEVLEWLETQFGVSKAVKALNQRIQKSSGGVPTKKASEDAKWKARTKQKQEDEVEEWDDFED